MEKYITIDSTTGIVGAITESQLEVIKETSECKTTSAYVINKEYQVPEQMSSISDKHYTLNY